MQEPVTASSTFSDRVVDLLWRKDSRHGACLLRLRTQFGRTTVDTLATFSWDPIHSDGWRRYAWDFPPRRADQLPGLTVFGSPEVEIEPATGDTLPHVSIVRIQRADYVPQDGEPVRIGDLLPLDRTVLASRIPLDDPFATAQLSVPQTDVARVRALPDGLVATHGNGQWEVRVTVDPRHGGGFAAELSPAPAGGLRVLAQSAYRMRIVRRGAVTVEYRQRTTRGQIRPGFGVHGDTSSVVDVDVGEDAGPALLPMSGLTLDRARKFNTVTAIPRYPEWETTVTNVVLTLATMVPALVGGITGFTPLIVLGTICDFGVPIYALITGRDLAGTEASTEQILLMGVLAMIGAAFDFGLVFLGMADNLLKMLIPAASRTAVHAALDPPLAQHLLRNTSPMLAAAITEIGEQDARRLIAALETAASGAPDAFRVVGGALDDVLAPLLAKIPSIGGIPGPLYREAMAVVHIADAPAYPALTTAEQVALTARYVAAVAAGDPGLLKLAQTSSELAGQYTELIRDAVVSRVFNAALDGFRTSSMDMPALGEALGAGYEAYRSAKAVRGETARNVVDWAFRQQTNSRYHAMLVAELGADFKDLLKPLVQRLRYAVDEKAATLYGNLAGDVDAYEVLRDLLTDRGVGALLQVDHILEQRFAHYFAGLLELGTTNFNSIVVPYNSIVVEGLKKFGLVSFPYTHVSKTARLRHWIPYRSEGKFTVQEIYNAYRLVYEYELGLGPRPLGGALEVIFNGFWDAVRAEAESALELGLDITDDIRLEDVVFRAGLDTTPLSEQQLLASVMAARSR